MSPPAALSLACPPSSPLVEFPYEQWDWFLRLVRLCLFLWSSGRVCGRQLAHRSVCPSILSSNLFVLQRVVCLYPGRVPLPQITYAFSAYKSPLIPPRVKVCWRVFVPCCTTLWRAGQLKQSTHPRAPISPISGILRTSHLWPYHLRG